MADHETLEESLDFAFVSKDGKFVGNRDAVLKYNHENADPLKEYGLPWRYDSNGALCDPTNRLVVGEPYRRFIRAFASLDEAAQRAFLMRVEDE